MSVLAVQPEVNLAPKKVGGPKHLDFVDGLRGYAALYVLVLHCMMWAGWWPGILPDPKIAVDVFMIVSGFLMVYHWNSREYGSGLNRKTVGRFLMKRFLRIAPLYYLVVAVAYLFAWPYTAGIGFLAQQSGRLPIRYDQLAAWHDFYLANLLAHLTFLFGATIQYDHWMLPDWSISLEMQFYLAFPFLLWALRKWGYLWVALACIPLMRLSLERAYPFFMHNPSMLFNKLPVFLIGILIAEANRLYKNKPSDAASLVFVAALMAMLGFSEHRMVLLVVAVILFVLTSAKDSTVFKWPAIVAERFLANRFTRFLADTSYGVYLTQFFFMSAFGWLLINSPWLQGLRHIYMVNILIVSVCVVAYGTAWVLHHAIEQPGIQLGKRLLAKSKQASV
jgi:peptidoglycan/LPS O-acetylase OafA/YrhL